MEEDKKIGLGEAVDMASWDYGASNGNKIDIDFIQMDLKFSFETTNSIVNKLVLKIYDSDVITIEIYEVSFRK